MIGTILMIACILLIGLGGTINFGDDETKEEDVSKSDEQKEDENMYVFLAILMAIITGAVFTFNTISINYCISNNFDLNQATYDSAIMLFVPLFALFMNEIYVNKFQYDLTDVIWSVVFIVESVIGVTCLSWGFHYGMAAPV